MKTNRLTKEQGFTCNPPGRGNHEAEHGKKLTSKGEAIEFLQGHPSWGIWLKATDQPGGLFFRFTIDGARLA